MKYLRLRASIFLTAVALAQAGFGQIAQALPAYSAKDDVEAARLYAAKNGHNEKAATLYSEAAKLLLQQNYSQAKPLLEAVLKLDPRLDAAYSSMGYCQLWTGYYIDGMNSLTQAIAIDSNEPGYFFRKALCHFSTEQHDETVNQLTRVLALKPNDPDALRLRGRCLKITPGGETNAIDDFSRLVATGAYTAEALCERGKIYARLGDENKAMHDFNEATQRFPELDEPYVCRANIFYQKHDYRLALDNYTAALVRGSDKKHFCEMQSGICARFLKSKGNPASLNAASPEHTQTTK
jgi:tetratricopeptide (TPR) repeat protein